MQAKSALQNGFAPENSQRPSGAFFSLMVRVEDGKLLSFIGGRKISAPSRLTLYSAGSVTTGKFFYFFDRNHVEVSFDGMLQA